MSFKTKNPHNTTGDVNINGSLTINGRDTEESPNDGKLNVKGELNISNDVGNYTIVPLGSELGLKDNHTGKLYRFVLKEIK
jgi:hypothetical protein